MIRLTAITSEEEPHSTVAAFLIGPTPNATIVHAGIRASTTSAAPDMVSRTTTTLTSSA